MKIASALLAFLMFTSVAQAHQDHDDVPPVAYKVDLANKKDGALFLVTLGGEKVATAGASGKLLLSKGANQHEVALKPSGDNGMATATPTRLVAGTRARALITLPGHAMATADFVIK
jgi:hypothetical protein